MRYMLGMIVLLLTSVEVQSQALDCTASESGLQTLILNHLERYPALGVQDLYKLLHQASLGSEHAVTDTAAVQAWMAREIASLGTGPPEPRVDTLGPGGPYARVHLRPYLEADGHPDRLVTAFIQTATRAPAGMQRFACARAAALRLAHDERLPWPEAIVARFFEVQEHAGDPAVHHSPEFVERYRPAYRLIALNLLDTLSLHRTQPD